MIYHNLWYNIYDIYMLYQCQHTFSIVHIAYFRIKYGENLMMNPYTYVNAKGTGVY